MSWDWLKIELICENSVNFLESEIEWTVPKQRKPNCCQKKVLEISKFNFLDLKTDNFLITYSF